MFKSGCLIDVCKMAFQIWSLLYVRAQTSGQREYLRERPMNKRLFFRSLNENKLKGWNYFNFCFHPEVYFYCPAQLLRMTDLCFFLRFRASEPSPSYSEQIHRRVQRILQTHRAIYWVSGDLWQKTFVKVQRPCVMSQTTAPVVFLF